MIYAHTLRNDVPRVIYIANNFHGEGMPVRVLIGYDILSLQGDNLSLPVFRSNSTFYQNLECFSLIYIQPKCCILQLNRTQL